MDIWKIVWQQYKPEQTLKNISEVLGYNRKAVRKYLRNLQKKGIPLMDDKPIDKEKFPVALKTNGGERGNGR